ncbi:MAG TPA: hypothetical protein VN495_03295 [Candidatus Paceibacterota bacterium]|nr:hypothetical protein [Candidatus Paceibacterota bacterium]
MKTNQKYVLLSLVTAIALLGGSMAALSSAQAVTPLTCSVNQSTVNTNQSATFTAVGGNGSYIWSGPNLNITNAAGTQFAVSYPTPGTYPITVTSAGLTATCNMTVVAASSGTLTCTPAVQSVTLGQSASVAASGGNGSYVWSSPDLTINNATGAGFTANFASTGLKTLTVSSNGASASCAVNVLSGGTVTPGLPNTGGGFGK